VEVDVEPEEEVDDPEPPNTLNEVEIGFSSVDVENDTSGRRAKRSVTCHITPTADGYPIVTPTEPGSCADAVGVRHNTHERTHTKTSL
jgi:hypothetical protein